MGNRTSRAAGIKAVLREPKRRTFRHVDQPSPDGNRRQRRAYAAQHKSERPALAPPAAQDIPNIAPKE